MEVEESISEVPSEMEESIPDVNKDGCEETSPAPDQGKLKFFISINCAFLFYFLVNI